MRILMHDEQNLELRDFHRPEFEVESADPRAHYSALQMFATSMALCTYSVLVAYSEQINADTHSMVVRIQWDYADDPYRIGNIDMHIQWPELPPSRLHAAQRVAEQCTLHHTLAHPPAVNTDVSR